MASADFRAKLHTRRFPWLLVMIALLLTPVAWGLGYLAVSTTQASSPPTCEGIGWGCSPGPDFSAILIAVLWLLGTAGVAIALLITELFWEAVAAARSVVVLTVFVGGIALLALMLGITWLDAVS